MEIFRHYYTGEEWGTGIFYNQHLNSFNFRNLDGSVISGCNAMVPTSMNGSSWRYNLDAKKQVYLYFGANHQFYNRKISSDMIGVHLSDNTTHYHAGDVMFDYSNVTAYRPTTVVFLPLKNNGFLLNIRSIGSRYNGGAAPNPSTESEDPRDLGFCTPTSTPSLNVKIYRKPINEGHFSSYDSVTGVLTFIGLPPCKGNSNWTYIYFAFNYNYLWTSNHMSYDNNTCNYIDYGDGRVISLPFKSNYIQKYDIVSYNEPTYSDINNNICSMIKLPYDNSYIDGVYLLTTAPQQLEDATFFSFDGRNFLNVFDNYVVELPSST